MTVSVVIPAYVFDDATHEMTMTCLARLREHSPEAELVLALRGPSFDYDADVIVKPRKVGYSPAVNAGIAKATGDVLVVGSADAYVKAGWLPPIVSALADIDIASPTHSGDGTLGHRHRGFCGVMFAMTRETWDRFGPLDEEEFKVRKGDQDFAVRACMGGASLGVVEDSQFSHVAPKHTKAKHGPAVIAKETEAFRARYGAATYARWRKLHP